MIAWIRPVYEFVPNEGHTKITGYRWELCAGNGARLAQQVHPSPTEKAAKQAFERFRLRGIELEELFGPWR